MGLAGWYPFIRKKGYNPHLLSKSVILKNPASQRHLDVLGTLFRTISNAYASNPPYIAHSILQNEIERYGTQENLILYLDGPPAEEKRATTDLRDKARLKALDDLGSNLDTFDKKLNESSRIRKQLHISIAKGFQKSFYWCLDIRQEFAEHMRHLGWRVQVGPTESDVAIARAAEDGDIVISGDSDMMAYRSITTVWRPVSNDLILVYNIPDVLKTLQISRVQLTALAIVSKNDYSRNIYGLGPVTNFGVIKRQTDIAGKLREHFSSRF
jgi:hypothetical protein